MRANRSDAEINGAMDELASGRAMRQVITF